MHLLFLIILPIKFICDNLDFSTGPSGLEPNFDQCNLTQVDQILEKKDDKQKQKHILMGKVYPGASMMKFCFLFLFCPFFSFLRG